LFLCRSHLFIAVIPLLSEQVRRRVSDAGGKRPHWSRPFGFGVGECFIFDLAFHVSRNGRVLPARIDRGELRLNHFADKLAKGSCGLPAKFFANLIRATGRPCWFCRPIKRRIMLHVFLPWKGNYMKDASNKFVRAPNRARICVTRSARCGRRVSQGVLQSYPNLIEEVRVNGVKNIQP